MTAANYADLGMRGLGLALAAYAIVGQVAKPILRLLVRRWRRGRAPTKGQEAALRAVVRSGAVVVGGGLGLLPHVWPADLPAVWGGMLGLAAGSMAPVVHLAVERALPARIAAIVAGGSVVHREDGGEPR